MTNEDLGKERKQITWDSFIHCIKKMDIAKDQYSRACLGEIFKYAVKMQDGKKKSNGTKKGATARSVVAVYYLQRKKRYRLLSAVGCFHWWGVEKVTFDKKVLGENIEKYWYIFDKETEEYTANQYDQWNDVDTIDGVIADLPRDPEMA